MGKAIRTGKFRGRLTANMAQALNQPGMYGDGDTLYLCVAKGGSKSWIQRLTIHGKRHDLGLGGYPLVSLAEARDKAWANRKLARDGGDPLAAKRQESMPTFAEACEATIQAHRERWRGDTTEKHWRQSLQRYALPALGEKRLGDIGQDDVLRILKPIWTTKPETGRKVRRRIRAIFAWAQAHKYVEHNIAGEAINGALPPMPAVQSHFRALPYRDMPRALETIASSSASLAVQLCFRFTVLTVARSSEARHATWSEIDLENRLWRIAGKRMKTGREHRVPLSAGTLEVLEKARILRDGSDWIFPSPTKRRRPLSDMAMTKLLRITGLADLTTVHGCRSVFRDWAADGNHPRELAEAALAHTVSGVEGAYFRSDLLDRRRDLMDQWSKFLTAQ